MYPRVSLIPHKTEGLSEIGKKNMLFIHNDKGWKPDDLSHEQSLVIDTASGLVIFNSCSHSGADNIINEVAATYPDKKIKALVGGFHTVIEPKDEVQKLAARMKKTGIEAVYTGHCTGQKSFNILREELGEKVHQFHSGFVMEF